MVSQYLESLVLKVEGDSGQVDSRHSQVVVNNTTIEAGQSLALNTFLRDKYNNLYSHQQSVYTLVDQNQQFIPLNTS